MSLCWTILTDGRKHYIQDAIPTWLDNFEDSIEQKFIIDDSGDPEYRQWLSNTFKSFNIVPVSNDRQGYDVAMKKLFSLVRELNVDYCFHIEDDFLLNKKFDIFDLAKILDFNKNMAQISLMRQPWYHNEKEHNGVVEAIIAYNPSAHFVKKSIDGLHWMEHNAYWTCNPHLFPSWLTNFEWPSGVWSESRFGRYMFEQQKIAGIYGVRQDWPYVEHIGREKYGNKY